MSFLDLPQAIVEHLTKLTQSNDDLNSLQGSMYIQLTPKNSALPYLQVDLKKSEKQNYQNNNADFQGQLQFTLVCSRSQTVEQIKAIQNALIKNLDRKQLVLTAHQFCYIWLEQCNDIAIEHDRICLSSLWQFRQS